MFQPLPKTSTQSITINIITLFQLLLFSIVKIIKLLERPCYLTCMFFFFLFFFFFFLIRFACSFFFFFRITEIHSFNKKQYGNHNLPNKANTKYRIECWTNLSTNTVSNLRMGLKIKTMSTNIKLSNFNYYHTFLSTNIFYS